MRTHIDAIREKMDQLLETMLTLAQKERASEIEAEAKRIASQVSTLGVLNLDGSFLCPKGGYIPIPVLVVNMDPQNIFLCLLNMDL